MDQDNISVQTAGVYQFLLRVLYPGVSRGTFAVMVSETVLTTATSLDAPVSLCVCFQFHCAVRNGNDQYIST